MRPDPPWHAGAVVGAGVAVLCGVGLLLTALGIMLARRGAVPGRLILGSAVALEVLLLAQAVIAVVGMVRGSGPEGPTVLFVSYLGTVVLVLPAAVAWSLVERDRWSNAVLAVAGFTVTAMVIRLWDVWQGGIQIGGPGG